MVLPVRTQIESHVNFKVPPVRAIVEHDVFQGLRHFAGRSVSRVSSTAGSLVDAHASERLCYVCCKLSVLPLGGFLGARDTAGALKYVMKFDLGLERGRQCCTPCCGCCEFELPECACSGGCCSCKPFCKPCKISCQLGAECGSLAYWRVMCCICCKKPPKKTIHTRTKRYDYSDAPKKPKKVVKEPEEPKEDGVEVLGDFVRFWPVYDGPAERVVSHIVLAGKVVTADGGRGTKGSVVSYSVHVSVSGARRGAVCPARACVASILHARCSSRCCGLLDMKFSLLVHGFLCLVACRRRA